MKLYIFNPHTDLALANNSENYQPSAKVRQMVCELEMLPMWFADPGSHILVSRITDQGFIEKQRELYGIDVEAVSSNSATLSTCDEIVPWGWNVSLRKQLSHTSIPAEALPTTEELQRYRALSGRDYDVALLKSLACARGRYTADILHDADSCREYATKTPRCIFKAPWSGSGKGLLWCFGTYNEKSHGRCSRIIKEQGFVVATPIYDKVADFALEFHSDGMGGITFVGYSLFETNTQGAYRGNILQSEAAHRATLARHIDLALLDAVKEELAKRLAEVYGNNYKGYLGVDMMICREGDRCGIHPCVEVNMRMNMGVLSVIFSQRYLAEGSRGLYAIEYFATHDELKKRREELERSNPLHISNGRLVSGFQPLIPQTPQSNYLAYVTATNDII